MLFRSIFLKTLRDYRIAILGWGLGLGLLMYVVLDAISSVTSTAAARASLVSLASSFGWLAEPIRVDTPGGYATWKYGFTILVLALWPILAGSRMLRGEETRGSMDALLSLPRGRGRVALEKLAAMWTALLLMARPDRGVDLCWRRACERRLYIWRCIAVWPEPRAGQRGLWQPRVAHLAVHAGESRRGGHHRRTAGAVHRGGHDPPDRPRILDWFSRLSPVYYYNLSKPLIPSYGTDPVAMLVMVVLSVVFSGAAIWLFVRRDVGATVALPHWLSLPKRAARPEDALPARAWSLQSIYTRSLAKMAVPTFWWTVVIAGYAALAVFITVQTEKQLKSLFESSPLFANLIGNLGGSDAGFNASLLGFFWVMFAALLMAFAVTQASRWAADEEDGLQELVLADTAAAPEGDPGAFRRAHHRDGDHRRGDTGAEHAGCGSQWPGARLGQPGRRLALDHSDGPADRGAGLPVLRLATHGD